MDAGQALGYSLSALGACIVAIGWWIATTLMNLSDKMERTLIVMESHDRRLSNLEQKGDSHA